MDLIRMHPLYPTTSGGLKYPDIDAGDGQQGSVNYEPTHCGDCGAEIASEYAQY